MADKPLRAVVRFAILGVSPSDILVSAPLTYREIAGEWEEWLWALDGHPLGGMAKAPLKTLIEGWARHGQENYYAPTAGAEETGGRGLATTHTGKGCVMAN